VVVGDKEVAAGTVAVRARGNRDLGTMAVDALLALLGEEIARKGAPSAQAG